jgi:hypothetical protein
MISTPGVSRGTTNMPLVHITKMMSAREPALVNHFSPVMTHSSPSRTAWVWNSVGSEPPCGSVMEYAENSSWFSNGYSQRCFCASVPCAASISMLPVSGAAVPNTTGADR